MIVHVTQGTTRISLQINGEDGYEPNLSLIQDDAAGGSASSSRWRNLSRPATLVLVGLLCGAVGYRFAPGRSETMIPRPELANALPDALAPSAANQDSPIPPQLTREMANRAVVTPTVPVNVAAKPNDTSPFGLE